METRKKILIAIVAVLVVGGAIAFQLNDSELFKGQLALDKQIETAEETTDISHDTERDLLPNLKASLSAIAPEEEGGDLILEVTIENLGPGRITGDTPYSYVLKVNETEVFRNTDSYTSMEAGDAISFQYPVPPTLYELPETGTATLIVDTENAIEEAEKDNNTVTINYSL